jgi:hypothetical protein
MDCGSDSRSQELDGAIDSRRGDLRRPSIAYRGIEADNHGGIDSLGQTSVFRDGPQDRRYLIAGWLARALGLELGFLRNALALKPADGARKRIEFTEFIDRAPRVRCLASVLRSSRLSKRMTA